MTTPPSPSEGYPPQEGATDPSPAQAEHPYSPGYYPPQGAFGAATYTSWGHRVLAFLIDWAPVAILSGIGSIFLVTMQSVETVCVTDSSEYRLGDFCATGSSGPSGLAWTLFALCDLIGLAFVLWNRGFRQGTTGSSIGKGILRCKVVGEETGQPIGAGKSIGRELLYIVAYLLAGIVWLVAVLFPLWDPKRQSLVDKLVKTVCLPL